MAVSLGEIRWMANLGGEDIKFKSTCESEMSPGHLCAKIQSSWKDMWNEDIGLERQENAVLRCAGLDSQVHCPT